MALKNLIKLEEFAAQTPSELFEASRSLKELSRVMELKAVSEAVSEGWTWEKIAKALDISRQAAHKKYSYLAKNKKR